MDHMNYFGSGILDRVSKRLKSKNICQKDGTNQKKNNSTIFPLVQKRHQQPQSKSVHQSDNNIARFQLALLELVMVLSKFQLISDKLSHNNGNEHGEGEQHA